MLSFIQYILREQEEFHHFVMPLMSGKPHTHVGHARDIVGGMYNAANKLGVKATSMIVGLHKGSKTDPLSGEEKAEIFRKQVNNPKVDIQPEEGMGGAIRRAIANSGKGKNHLHIVVGFDRINMGHELANKIKSGVLEPYDIPRNHFDTISVHGPDGKEYKPGDKVPAGNRMIVGGKPISGTRLRETIVNKDKPLWQKMTGPAANDDLWNELQRQRSKIKVKRPGSETKINAPIDENFIDGKHPEHKGDMARHGLKGKSISELKKVLKSNASPRKKQLAHWYINMHSRGK